jgi:transposase
MPREWWDPLSEDVKRCFLGALESKLEYYEQSNRYYTQTLKLEATVTKLEKQVKDLNRQLLQTQKDLEAAKRAEKRQATPFSKGPPKKNPKRPGRSHGHTPAHRPRPEKIDQVVEVSICSCPECHRPVEADRFEEQVIEDVEIRPLVRKIVTHSAFCVHCRKRVKARSPGQLSQAVGAAGVQLGDQVLALAADLKHRLGIPYRKIVDFFKTHFGLKVSPGCLVRAGQRLEQKLKPTHDSILASLRASSTCNADETSWKIGGHNAWLWVFTNQSHTAYVVRKGRGQAVVREVLGDDYQGILASDCYCAYDSLPWRKAKCLGHIIHEMSDLLAEKKSFARSFLREALSIFRDAITLKPRKASLRPSTYQGLATRIEKRLNGLLRRESLTDPDNLRLQKRFHRQREHLLRFLYHDEVQPTNNHAERQIRPAVIARKLSGCNRTPKGAQTHEVLASVAVTCRQQSVSFVDLARAALTGQPTHIFEPRASPA